MYLYKTGGAVFFSMVGEVKGGTRGLLSRELQLGEFLIWMMVS